LRQDVANGNHDGLRRHDGHDDNEKTTTVAPRLARRSRRQKTNSLFHFDETFFFVCIVLA